MTRPLARRTAGLGVLLIGLALRCPAQLPVAATTTFIGDLVQAIGGSAVAVEVVYPRDADPHAYEPTPRDLARLQGRRVLFVNGLGLEEAMQGPLKTFTGAGLETVDLSHGITPRGGHEHHGEIEADPHVWYDPVALLTWTTNIETALTRLLPNEAAGLRARAEATRTQLRTLDQWIRTQVETVPPARRVLVTDHDALGYFAARYGFRLVGTVMPSFSTLAEPSAQDLRALERVIRREQAPALFVSSDSAPALARRMAEDTHCRLVTLPGCALGPAGSPTGTLDGYLRALTTRLVESLR